MPDLNTISDVVDWRLCLGCGACAALCPSGAIELRDFPGEGIRPVVRHPEQCGRDSDAFKVCPSVKSDFQFLDPSGRPLNQDSFTKEWGPVLEVWEGHATDPEIRFKGSSGGALTALSAYCIEQLGMHGVLHTGPHPADPARNQTRISRTRAELLAAVGSRYSPASVCDGLNDIEHAPAPCVVIGKPVDIAAVKNARQLRPAIDRNVGVTLSFFCAETPATGGTLALLAKLGVPTNSLKALSYRGDGWPGYFAPLRSGETTASAKMTYKESWAFLQRFRPWATQLWPDGSGELADISCGDPWYEKPDGKNPGFSLVVVRTERGREIVRGAMKAGYIELTSAERWKLEKSQGYLLAKKASIWGRRRSLQLFGLPITRFPGLDLFHSWKKLTLDDKLRSTVGTIRRVFSRKLYRRNILSAEGSTPVGRSRSPGAVSPKDAA